MSIETEFYDILEIKYTATMDEIKKAYRRKALIHHPDKGGKEEDFKKISIAYETLVNPEKRDLYDRCGQNANNDTLSNMFGNMFTGMFFKCEHIVYKYKVTLEDLCTRKVGFLKVMRHRLCPCNDKSKYTLCKCRNVKRSFFDICKECNGQGKNYIYCGKCGNGIVKESKVFEIHLNPEMENNFRYVFQNEGNQDNFGTSNFIAVICYEKHHTYTVKGKDLSCEQSISLKDALCGLNITIKHPSGEILNVNHTNVISPGYILKIPQKGLSYGGNMEVIFSVKFPEKITKEQSDVFMKFF